MRLDTGGIMPAMARLYFDGPRSRLVETDGWYDFSALQDVAMAKNWCEANDVDFFDHRIANYDEWMRRSLLRARAACRGKRKWVLRWDDVSRQIKTRYPFPFPLPSAHTPYAPSAPSAPRTKGVLFSPS